MNEKISREQIVFFSLKAGLEAANILLKYYDALKSYEIELKSDGSPVTIADNESDRKIRELLAPSGIYIISEETEASEERLSQELVWLVDPLDGTKEFIKKNGEFSVNIALVRNTRPYFGLIMAPAKGLICYGFADDKPLFGKIKTEEFMGIEVDQILSLCKPIQSSLQKRDEVTKIGSRSHADPKEQDLINCWLPNKTIESSIQVGSALKFITMAFGTADIYLRTTPTMEWDTAAGHALLLGCGGNIFDLNSKRPLVYNKTNLLNPGFVALRDADFQYL